MKKKVAIVLSVILACSMSMTAMAAPSPSIQKEPVAQVVVNPTVGTAGNNVAVQATTVNSEKSAVLPGTTFKTASGQVVDPAAVAMVVAPSTAEQAQAAAASLVAALASSKMQVVNFTGKSALSLTAVAQNGSVSAAFALTEILGGTALAEGETIQALYQRADGTWVAVPVVIKNGTVAIALPAFGGAVNVTFVVAKGASLEDVPATTSPRT